MTDEEMARYLRERGWKVSLPFKPPPLHRYEPNKKNPWFCGICGYAEHEPLQHIQERKS